MITTASRPLIISAPRIGFLNLLEDCGEQLQNRDAEAFASLFEKIECSTRTPPECDVLVLYLSLTADGDVANTDLSLEQIIGMSGAPIVLVASENAGDAYINATRWFGASSSPRGCIGALTLWTWCRPAAPSRVIQHA